MSKIWFKSTSGQAFSLFALGAVVIAIISLILWLSKGHIFAYSFALGGLVSLLPNFVFAYQFFRRNKPSEAKRIVISMYKNEFYKLIFMALIFILVVTLVKLALWPFILGFLVAQMSIWLAPLLLINGVKR